MCKCLQQLKHDLLSQQNDIKSVLLLADCKLKIHGEGLNYDYEPQFPLHEPSGIKLSQ